MQKKSSDKAERRDKTYGALEAFPDFLERFTPPAGEFDPRGAWKQTYAMRLFAEESGTIGYLEIERRPAPDGVALTVATRFAHSNGYQEETAKLSCGADRLGSLRSIEIESVLGGQDNAPVAATRMAASGVVRGASIEWTRGGRKRTVPAPPPLVASWSLLEAVGRMKPGEKPVEFTLLDNGDLVKPAQRLLYAGKTEVKVAGGASLALDCWEQTGYGVLPAHYWVDAQHRLLFAVAGQKAYLYDPDARKTAGARTRGRKK